MKMKLVVLVTLFLLVGSAQSACDYAYLSQWVRAVGDWTGAFNHSPWEAADDLGLMVFNEETCLYEKQISGLPAGTNYLWKITILGTWNENYGCQGRDGPNCAFTVPASGTVKFMFNYKDKIASIQLVGSNPTSAPPTTAPTTAPTSAPTTPAPTLPPSGSGKQVFAHFMMGNAYGYDQAHFEADMLLAKAAGIDAFALNVGQDTWSIDRTNKAYAAAVAVGFKLFFSFDMNYWSTVNSIADHVASFASSPAQYKYNNKVFVSTFGGSWVDMGGGVDASWLSIRNNLLNRNPSIPTFIVPNFAVYPVTIFSTYPNIDGAFGWGAWPDPNTLPADDNLFMTAANTAGKVYMAPWSPLFFTHLSYKYYMYDSDDLWFTRWQQLLSVNPHMIEIITWNDWGEAHYIGPIDPDEGDWPAGSHGYVRGFNHEAWLDALPYFIGYYKTGAAPAVTKDIVTFWYLPFLKDSTTANEGLPAVYFQNMTNSNLTPGQVLEDKVFILTVLKAASTIQVNSGGTVTSHSVPAGAYLTKTQVHVGQQSVTLLRNSVQICSSTGGKSVSNSPTTYNFNYYVSGCKV